MPFFLFSFFLFFFLSLSYVQLIHSIKLWTPKHKNKNALLCLFQIFSNYNPSGGTNTVIPPTHFISLYNWYMNKWYNTMYQSTNQKTNFYKWSKNISYIVFSFLFFVITQNKKGKKGLNFNICSFLENLYEEHHMNFESSHIKML